jgi:hypothetical protein
MSRGDIILNSKTLMSKVYSEMLECLSLLAICHIDVILQAQPLWGICPGRVCSPRKSAGFHSHGNAGRNASAFPAFSSPWQAHIPQGSGWILGEYSLPRCAIPPSRRCVLPFLARSATGCHLPLVGHKPSNPLPMLILSLISSRPRYRHRLYNTANRPRLPPISTSPIANRLRSRLTPHSPIAKRPRPRLRQLFDYDLDYNLDIALDNAIRQRPRQPRQPRQRHRLRHRQTLLLWLPSLPPADPE